MIYAKVIYKLEAGKCSQMKYKGHWKFQGRKVGVISEEGWSLLSPKSKRLKRAEKGCLRMVEDFVNFVDMGGCNDCFSYGLYGLYGFSFTFC